jgi:hypothetical protein
MEDLISSDVTITEGDFDDISEEIPQKNITESDDFHFFAFFMNTF